MIDPRWCVGPAREYAGGDTVHQRFRLQARLRPEGVAIVDGDRELRYGELDTASDRLAGRLAAAGVVPGTIVPVHTGRCTELVIALLAVLKRGAAYAAMDPRWPLERASPLARLVRAPVALFSGDGLEPPGPALRIEDGAGGGSSAASEERPAPSVGGFDPCTVFFTSGSTGEPKAVLSSHRATTRLFDRCVFADLGPRTVMAVAAPVTWDGLTLELWSALLNGGTAVLVHEDVLLPDVLRGLVRRRRLDSVWLTSSLFNLFVDEDLGAFAGLRQVLTGGERASPAHVSRFLAAHPAVRLVNGYGPVETCVFATTHDVRCSDGSSDIPIGRPVANTRVFVVRPDGGLCGVGETGEILVAGDGLALGYLGDERATAAAFGDVELLGRVVRCYRTGDLGSWSPGGELRFAGRVDRQVKVRGRRVELDGIQAVLQGLEGVDRCAVAPVPGPTPGTHEAIWAFYTARADIMLSPERVTAALRAALLPHQVPDRVVLMERLPLSPTGKVDETGLLASASRAGPSAAAGPAEGAPPEGAAAAVAAAFREVLGRPSVPADLSFFALGGTSLGAGRLAARLTDRLGVAVPVSRVMAADTVSGLGRWLEDRLAERDATPAGPVDDGDGVPLTESALGFWVAQQLDPTDRSAHCLMAWAVTGRVDAAVLRAALVDVQRRQEALRARYVLSGTTVVARPEDRDGVDFAALPPAASAGRARGALLEVLGQPFDVEAGSVWRAALVPGDGCQLGIAIHHLAFDGWSESVLARDLSIAYAARHAGRAPVFAAPAPSLAGLRRHLLRRNALAGMDEQRSHWARVLAGLPRLTLPAVDEGSPAGLSRVDEAVVVPDVAAGLARRSAALEGSPFAAWLSCCAHALRQVAGQVDFGIGVPVARRTAPGAEAAVGCLLNTICLRLPAESDLRRLLPGAVETVRRGLAAQDVPFSEVVHTLRPGRASGAPLYQAMFALQQHPEPQLRLPGATAVFWRPDPPDLLTDLLVEVWPASDGGARVRTAHRHRVAAAAAREVRDRLVAAAAALGRGP